MVCEHLSDIETALAERGIGVTFRGRSWSVRCREWVYFDAYLDTDAIRDAYALPACVRDHTHRGTHDGQEHGLVCEQCHDALMGLPHRSSGKPAFPN